MTSIKPITCISRSNYFKNSPQSKRFVPIDSNMQDFFYRSIKNNWSKLTVDKYH